MTLLDTPENCVICHQPTLEARRVIGQGTYYPGMSEEERRRVAESITIIPCHNACHQELTKDD